MCCFPRKEQYVKRNIPLTINILLPRKGTRERELELEPQNRIGLAIIPIGITVHYSSTVLPSQCSFAHRCIPLIQGEMKRGHVLVTGQILLESPGKQELRSMILCTRVFIKDKPFPNWFPLYG